MEALALLILIVIGTFLIGGGLAVFRILLGVGRIILTVFINMVIGILLLFVVNMLPFAEIPLNFLTILVAGLGGITGVGILLITSIIGII